MGLRGQLGGPGRIVKRSELKPRPLVIKDTWSERPVPHSEHREYVPSCRKCRAAVRRARNNLA